MLTREQIIEKIAKTDFFKSLEKEEVDRITQERKEAVASLKTAEKASAKAHRELEKRVEVKRKELRAAEQRKRELQREFNALEHDFYNVPEALVRREKARVERFLRETAHSRIDDAISLFRKGITAFRGKEIYAVAYNKQLNFTTLSYDFKIDTNYDRLAEGVLFSQRGIEELRSMQFDPVLDEEKLEGLISGLYERAKGAGVVLSQLDQ